MNDDLKQILADLKEIRETNAKTLAILTEVYDNLNDYFDFS